MRWLELCAVDTTVPTLYPLFQNTGPPSETLRSHAPEVRQHTVWRPRGDGNPPVPPVYGEEEGGGLAAPRAAPESSRVSAASTGARPRNGTAAQAREITPPPTYEAVVSGRGLNVEVRTWARPGGSADTARGPPVRRPRSAPTSSWRRLLDVVRSGCSVPTPPRPGFASACLRHNLVGRPFQSVEEVRPPICVRAGACSTMTILKVDIS